MTSKRPRRSPRRPAYRKLAISVPSDLADALAGAVHTRRAASVSAYVAEAIEEKLERDRLQEALDEVWRDRPMTEQEREWADKLLLG